MTSTPPEGIRLERLRRRGQFLETARGRKVVTPAFVLQSCDRRTDDPTPTIGVGFTATRRLGNAVARNRAKRRLREAARHVLPYWGRPGRNYVLIARQAVLTWPFDKLQDDLREALMRPTGAAERRRARRPASSAS